MLMPEAMSQSSLPEFDLLGPLAALHSNKGFSAGHAFEAAALGVFEMPMQELASNSPSRQEEQHAGVHSKARAQSFLCRPVSFPGLLNVSSAATFGEFPRAASVPHGLSSFTFDDYPWEGEMGEFFHGYLSRECPCHLRGCKIVRLVRIKRCLSVK